MLSEKIVSIIVLRFFILESCERLKFITITLALKAKRKKAVIIFCYNMSVYLLMKYYSTVG